MENRILNNITSLDPDDGLEIIEEIFKNNFPNYVQKKTYNWGGFHGYGVIIEKDNIEIKLGSARGMLEYYLIINEVIDLQKHDKRLKNVNSSSKENFYFVSSVIKKIIGNG